MEGRQSPLAKPGPADRGRTRAYFGGKAVEGASVAPRTVDGRIPAQIQDEKLPDQKDARLSIR